MIPNNPPPLNVLNPNQGIRVQIQIDHKVFYQQHIVFLFGATRLGEILASPHPFILPLIFYHTSCDVFIFFLV